MNDHKARLARRKQMKKPVSELTVIPGIGLVNLVKTNELMKQMAEYAISNNHSNQRVNYRIKRF